MKLRNLLLLNLIIFFQSAFSQEGIAVYTDYLTDNYYLIHPSMAGASNCAKLRVTGRQQWFGQQDAPALQTLSFNTSVSDKDGLGIILVNDRNGYHSQKGFRVAYAHHIMFSRDNVDCTFFRRNKPKWIVVLGHPTNMLFRIFAPFRKCLRSACETN